jgi:UDP-2,3-diacylglucosamine hydrolase
MEFNNALLISDLHLTPTMPRTAERFVEFCEKEATQVEALFILGDLFEYWVGDDAHLHSPFQREVAKQLKQLSKNGVKVFFLKGNRDFLIGSSFAAQANWTEISDPSLVQIGGQSWILSHGDSLCTADESYQRFRFWVRQSWVQKIFCTLPLSFRKSIAEKLRRNSTVNYQKSQRFTPEISNIRSDVTKKACSALIKEQQCNHLIHGHTHRPGLYQEAFNDTSWKRWVLSDWDFDHPETVLPKGSALRIDETGATYIDLVH